MDSRDLVIEKVVNNNNELKFSIAEKHEAFGSAIEIDLGKKYNK